MATRITDNGKGYKNLAHKARVSSFHLSDDHLGDETRDNMKAALKSMVYIFMILQDFQELLKKHIT